jgi:hypothetical protein
MRRRIEGSCGSLDMLEKPTSREVGVKDDS